MIRFIILILISFFPLFRSFSTSDQINIHHYNSELNEEILVLANNMTDDAFERMDNYINKNSDIIPYRIVIAEISDNLEEKNFSDSLYYLDNELMEVPRHTFYLDHDIDSGFRFYAFNNKILPELNMIRRILSLYDIEDREVDLFPLYMTNILPNPDILELYHKRDVPLIMFKGKLDIEVLFNLLKTPDNVDNSGNFYLLTSILGRNIYIGESAVLITVTIFYLLSFILMTIFSKRILFHFRNNKKYILSLPIKLLAVFMFYFIATLVLEYIVDLSGHSGFTYSYPRAIFFAKNLLQYFIYSVCFHIIKDTTFSKSPYLYSYISFFISMGIFIYISQIYLPLGLYQIWPMVMTIFFILSRKRSHKRFFMFLSPIIIITIFIKYLSSEHKHFVDLFVMSRYRGNLLLTLLSSPYLFLQDSYHRFVRRRQNKVVIQKDIVSSILLLTMTITLIAILLELNQKI